MIDRIKKLLANPNLSEANRKALMDMQEAEYKANGGRPDFGDRIDSLGDSIVGGGIDAVTKKINEALGLGVPKEDIYRTLRNNAMKTRNASARAALLQAGTKGLDIANQNQAGLITQAGEKQSAFTPRAGALSQVGEGAAGVARAEAQYGREVAGIAKQQQEHKLKEEKKAKTESDELEAIRTLGDQAKKAYELVNGASQAIYAKQKIIAAWNQAYQSLASTPLVNQGAGAIEKAMENGVTNDFNVWQQGNPKASEAYGVLERVVTQLTTGALAALGPGPKTDFDFIVAGRTVADLTGTPVKIKATLADAVTVANSKLKKKIQKPIEFTTSDTPADGTGTVKTTAGGLISNITSGVTNFITGDAKPVTLEGLQGQWLTADSAQFPQDILQLLQSRPGEEYEHTDGKFYVWVVGNLYGGTLYVREG